MVLGRTACNLTALRGAQARLHRLCASPTPEAAAQRHLADAMARRIRDVFRDQRAGDELVHAVNHRAIAAGDQLGVVLNADKEAAVAGPQARLFRQRSRTGY